MTITLTPKLEKLVQKKIARGEYDSADALVGEAVLRLIEEEKEEHRHREKVPGRIEAAEAEIGRGEYVEYDENTIHKLASDVHERGLNRLAADRKKTGANR